MSPSHLRGRLGIIGNLFTGGGLMIGVIIAGLFSLDSKFAYAYGWRFDYYIVWELLYVLLVFIDHAQS